MGKNYAGILGQFTGKIGNVVGAVSRGVQTTRIYQPIVNNPNTQKQQLQRQFMRDACAFYKEQCKYFFGDMLKKKYYSTTAYAQIISKELSLIGANRFGTEDRIKTFMQGFMTKSSLGRGIVADIPIGIKSVQAEADGPYEVAVDETGTALQKVGLQLPVNFYKEALDSGEEVGLLIYAMWYTDQNQLVIYEYGESSSGAGRTVQVNEDFDPADTANFKIVDGVVIPTCKVSADLYELHTQYFVQLLGTPQWADTGMSDYINKIAGKNVGLVTVWCQDSLGNVFDSVNYTLPVITG